MVTYGGMAKQPVIASVVSWWGRQTWTQAWTPQLSRPSEALVPGGGLYLQQSLKRWPSEPQLVPLVSTEPAHF